MDFTSAFGGGGGGGGGGAPKPSSASSAATSGHQFGNNGGGDSLNSVAILGIAATVIFGLIGLLLVLKKS